PSTLKRSVILSTTINRIAVMIQRVMKASSQAMPSVTTVSTAKSSQPSRKFRIPRIAATMTALQKSLTWNPGSTAAVIQTASDNINPDSSKPMCANLQLQPELA